MENETFNSTAPGRPSTRRRAYLLALLVLAVLLAALAVGSALQAPKTISLAPATVDYVIDGDTVDVIVEGNGERVRLIGIDAPESASHDESQNTLEGAEATAFLRSWLPSGTTVYLQVDVEDRDRYGRLLRYVWTEQPVDPSNSDEVRAKMVNARMLEAGYADTLRYEPNTYYADLFEEFKEDAADQGAGISHLWS